MSTKLPIFNLVELVADAEDSDCAYDQPCCHHTWYTGGKVKDEDCEGFKPNEGGVL